MGLRLLRLSGWPVKEDVVKRMTNPIVIENDFTYPVDNEMSAFMIKAIKDRISDTIVNAAHKHVFFEINEDGNKRTIRGILIVQREDPPSNA